MDYASLLETFQTSLLTNDMDALATSISPHPHLTAQQQLAIYSEGYRLRLYHAIASDYPAVMTYIGSHHFKQLARRFIELHPPAHFNLDRYPFSFATFLHNEKLEKQVIELATLESAIAEVFWAEETIPLEPASLSSLSEEAFGNLTLQPRTASALLACEFAVDEWLQLHRQGCPPASLPPAAPHFLFIYRHHHSVRRIALTPAAGLLLRYLCQGKSVADALEYMTIHHPEHNQMVVQYLQSWFEEWLAKGFFKAA